MIVHNLPAQATPFVGRSHELADIAGLLNDPACRLLTLVGPGGIGKTRLALEAAAQLLTTPAFVSTPASSEEVAFRNGIYFVPLQPLNSPDFIVSTIANAVNFQFYAGGEPKQQLLDYLREKFLLIVLDNFEHLLDGAELVSEILAYAPEVKVLATSRERLNLLEEWVLDVLGLPVPASEAETEIGNYGAVQLFVQNARRVQVGFALTDTQKPAVTRICRLVGGMPLGIELASAWVRALSCEEIAIEIERSLDILATPARNVPPRHRNMRAVLEHSWKLLTEEEQSVFRKLSVFRGGFTREAAEQVAGASLHTLATLVDKSLLRVDANGRYDVHELLRQYAREKLTESDETKDVMERHRDYFLAFAESAEVEFFGVNQLDWFNRLEAEHSNLRAAIGWSLESGDIAAGLRLTGSLYYFWAVQNRREGYERLMDILSLPEANVRTTIRAKALNGAGRYQWVQGNYHEARLLLEEALAIAREVGDGSEVAVALRNLGPVLYSLGEYEAAGRSLEESLPFARQLQDQFGIAWSLMFLGDVALKQRSAEQAQRLYEESIDLLRQLGDKTMLTYAVRRLGVVMIGNEDYERSKALCQEGLKLNIMIGDRRGVAACLVGLAGLAIAQGYGIHATQLLGAAERLLNDIAGHLFLPDRLEYERHMQSVRTQLDTPTFDRAWAEGQSMTMEQAVAYALFGNNPEAAQPSQEARQTVTDPLTTRELEILHLMAQGTSNREIAEQLFLSLGTVKWYINQIFSKLHVANRTQAAARAHELGLV
jgi:predicted ATPase/DNA-binding CsgD family transcriptional regulator